MSGTFAVVFICSVLLPCLGIMMFMQYGRLSFCLTFLGMFISITRYQAFNIRTAIHYTLYWMVVSAVVIAPLFGIVAIATPTINRLFHAQFSVIGLFSLLLLSSSAALLHFQWIQPKLNHKFFKRKFHLRDQAIVFSEKISQLNAVEPLVETIQNTFKSILYASYVNVITSESTPRTGEIAIPLSVNDAPIGTIIVSEKKNLKPYSQDELTFMNRISHQTAIFLNNAILFDALKATNQELLQLQDELLRSEREKVAIEQHQTHTQELARGIIHEVKNTHFAVSNFVTLILNRTISNPMEIEKILGVIGEQSTKLHLFSKNYLHHELIRSQLYIVRRAPISVETLIQDAITCNTFFIDSHQLAIQVNVTPTDTISADRDKLHLVVSNLINNAAKYQKMNQLTITGNQTETGYEMSFRSQLTPSVRDPHFEDNTGLGLRVSAYIIEYHKGTMSIDKSPTTFTITIKVPGYYAEKVPPSKKPS